MKYWKKVNAGYQHRISMWMVPNPNYRGLRHESWAMLPGAECSKHNLFGTATHLTESIIKLDFLMSCNFYFTCQSQTCSFSYPYSQILFGWLPLIPGTSTQHQVRGNISTHPLPNLSFHPHHCRLLSGNGWSNMALLPESWHRLQMYRVTRGPLTPLARAPAWPSGASRAGASHSSHPPACLPARHSPPLRPSDRLHSFCSHLFTSLSPAVSYLLPRTEPMGHQKSQHAVVAQNPFTYTMGS